MLLPRYTEMKEQKQKDGCIRSVIMQTIRITGQEAKEHLRIYKLGSALSSVKKIINNPKRVSELGFSLKQFEKIDEDLKRVNEDYLNWCKNMEIKYQIHFTGDVLFNIDYVEKTISF